MPSLRSYPKVYNFGHRAIADLMDGPVVVQEKIDGSQFSAGVIDGKLYCRSHHNALNLEEPPKMFRDAVSTFVRLHKEWRLREGWTYRGETLMRPKHNVLNYGRCPQLGIMLFDIDEGMESFVGPASLTVLADSLGLESAPLLFNGTLKSRDQLEALLETDSILGNEKIEGVVVKNYNRFGRDGHALMGKWVSPKFRERHGKEWKANNKNSAGIIEELATRFRTEARWAKAAQHLMERGELEESLTDIGRLMKEVSADVYEECREEICEMLFKWAWKTKKLSREITRGLPEWWKERMTRKQFGEPDVTHFDQAAECQPMSSGGDDAGE
jgi:hypothetical protein